MCDCLNCSDITIPQGSQGPTGPQGLPGSNGTNGIDGVSILHNDLTEYTSSGTSLYTFTTYTLPGNTLSDDDIIHIKSRWTADAMDYFKSFYVYFNGASIADYFLNPYNENSAEIDVFLTRTGTTTGKYTAECKTLLASGVGTWNYSIGNNLFTQLNPITVTNWTTGKDIAIKGTAPLGGTLKCVLFQVTHYKKV